MSVTRHRVQHVATTPAARARRHRLGLRQVAGLAVVGLVAACGPSQVVGRSAGSVHHPVRAPHHALARPTPAVHARPKRPVVHQTPVHPRKLPLLQFGDSGPLVRALQERLSALGYWLGRPDGTFGDATQQAVYALQKVAGLTRDGVVGPKTQRALAAGLRATPRFAPGHVVEVNLARQLVMLVNNGQLEYAFNTSTAGGYTFSDGPGQPLQVAVTPTGHFKIAWEIDGNHHSPLGWMWRPKFFNGGIALHGDTYVPPFPVSHGCVRVSIEAINWIWATNQAPIGTPVWVY